MPPLSMIPRSALGLGLALATLAGVALAQPQPFPTEPALRCLEGQNPGFVTAAGRGANGAYLFVRHLPDGRRSLCDINGGNFTRTSVGYQDHVPNAEEPALSLHRRCAGATPVMDAAERPIAWFSTVLCN